MACNLQTMDGCKIEVGTGLSVANCDTELVETDYAGVTDWTVVGGIQNGGYQGQQWNTTEVKPLAGGKKTAKAGHDNGTLQANIAWESTDAGMTMMETAYASKTAELAVQVTYPNGIVYHAQGLVTTLSLPNGSQDDVMSRDVTISLNHRPVTA